MRAYEIVIARGAVLHGGGPGETTGEVAATGTPNVYYVEEDDQRMLFVDRLAGTNERPIVIRADGTDADFFDADGRVRTPDQRPQLQFRLNLRSDQYVYFKNIRVVVERGYPLQGSGFDTVQCQTIPGSTMPTHHILFRGCEMDGGWRPNDPENLEYEVMKANQCQDLYLESCQIHGAAGVGKNAVDWVAVQYGHVVDCDLYDASTDWVIYAKGGSAYVRIEGNRIHDAPLGVAAGEGTNTGDLVSPWWHYEAYAVQIVNNLVYDIARTGVGVYGGFDVLVAHNTLFDVGWGRREGLSAGQMIEFALGRRPCRSAAASCRSRIGAPNYAWGTTHPDEPGPTIVPSRHLAFYGNVLWNPASLAAGAHMDWTTDFNVFTVAANVERREDIRDGAPTDELPLAESGWAFPLRADGGGIDMVGNVVSVNDAPVSDTRLVSPASDPGFVMRFDGGASPANVRGLIPQLHTTPGPDFLRPAGSSSNVITDRSFRAETPPPQPASFSADLPRPGGPSDPRPAWPEARTAPLDLDKACRTAARPVPGARATPLGTTSTPTDVRPATASAPEVNYVFSASGTITVEDVAPPIPLPGASGTGFLQSRTFRGEDASPSAGAYGYEYRVALEWLTAPAGTPCIVSLSLDFGPARLLDYTRTGAAGAATELFVLTNGGLGSVQPSAVRRSGNRLTFEFSPGVCVGAGTFFMGLASANPPRDVVARLTDSAGGTYDLPARAPTL